MEVKMAEQWRRGEEPDMIKFTSWLQSDCV